MESKHRLIRARIQLQQKNPFFSFLAMNLNLIEKKAEEGVPTMAVDNYGNLYYNKDFVDGLSEEELYGVMIHELLHLIFNHLSRTGKRDQHLANCCMDLTVNDIVLENNFRLPSGKYEALIPHNHEFTFKLPKGKTYTVKNIDKKSFEKIYDELYGKIPKQKIKVYSASGFDKHIRGKKNKTAKEIKEEKEMKKRWKQLMVEGATIARQRGELPAGLNRLVEELIEPKVNWKTLLYSFVTNFLPFDYDYGRPSKRSISAGFYMPHIKKENMEIQVITDTSGSISQKELTEFLSEMVAISKSFANLQMRVITCDSKVQEDLLYINGNLNTILDLKMKGGGGTSMVNGIKYVIENYPNTKLIILFTDGYSDMPTESDCGNAKLIWVICRGGVEDNQIPFGNIIRLEN